MALSVTQTPIKTINTYDSKAISTTQIVYKFNEDALAGKESYVLLLTITEIPAFQFYAIPQSNGDITCDVGKAVANAMADVSQLLTFNYEAAWIGGNYGSVGLTSIFAVTSKIPILSEHGANLYNYTPQPVYFGKLLTVFEEPRMWVGWWKVMQLISMDYGLITFDFDNLDINRQLINTTQDSALDSVPNILDMRVPEPASSLAEYVRMSGLDTATPITEPLTLKLSTVCDNPVMIEWVNRLGGRETWLFQYQQTITNVVESGIQWETPITGDIETERGTKRRYAPKDTQFMTLKSVQLNADELQGLHDIKESNSVKLWLDQVGTEYVNVRVSSGYSDDFTTGKSNYEFSLKIELPDNFDFLAAKLY